MADALDALWQAAHDCHLHVEAGDLGRLGPVLRALEGTEHPVARAWVLALRAQLVLMLPRYGAVPRLSRIEDFVEGPPRARAGAIRAARDGLLAALLAFDAPAVTAYAKVAAQLVPGLSDGDVLTTEMCGAWQHFTSKQFEDCENRCAEIIARAPKLNAARTMVEAQALRALCRLLDDTTEQALALGRRASLAARSEGIPHAEFLAHGVLARSRRYAGQSHLALRILEALRPVVTAPWRGWLAWEWLMSGGDPASALRDLDSTASNFATDSARTLAALLQAAMSKEGSAAGELLETLGTRATFAMIEHDATCLVAAASPNTPSPSTEVEAWRYGAQNAMPRALDGLRLRGDGGQDEESAAAYVLYTAEGRGSRVLHWGLSSAPTGGALRIKQSKRAQGRVETVLSVLALAGPTGLEESECFAATYGFPFVPELHRGVFEVLLHRARATLGDAGSIHKHDERLELRSEGSLIIPDPRVSQLTRDRVLRVLSEKGQASAKEMAKHLGISLRSAQGALAQLSEQGACETQKQGRSVAYVVEDTVFSEPTLRLRADQLTGLTTFEP
ncbi:MAG: hypothetical protein R3B13_03230 [Polyangiaceae bacterium]